MATRSDASFFQKDVSSSSEVYRELIYICIMFYVYVLLCLDGTYYTGITNNLRRRIAEHQSGLNKKSYTFKRRPVELVYKVMFTDVIEAIAFEKKIKKWSVAKKEALIAGRFEILPELSKKKNWKKKS